MRSAGKGGDPVAEAHPCRLKGLPAKLGAVWLFLDAQDAAIERAFKDVILADVCNLAPSSSQVPCDLEWTSEGRDESETPGGGQEKGAETFLPREQGLQL